MHFDRPSSPDVAGQEQPDSRPKPLFMACYPALSTNSRPLPSTHRQNEAAAQRLIYVKHSTFIQITALLCVSSSCRYKNRQKSG
jgi:hypothetical protein